MRNVLQDRYYNIGSVIRKEDKYLVQTRSQSNSSNIKIPEDHGVEKGINPHVQPKNKHESLHYYCPKLRPLLGRNLD